VKTSKGLKEISKRIRSSEKDNNDFIDLLNCKHNNLREYNNHIYTL
jgi:predicted 2-oxoglutarate/Fe(II)-dependent dioxygenase YbiX